MAERVAVVGAGQMGNGIAHVFAQSGYDVTMLDVSADALKRGKDTIAGNLDRAPVEELFEFLQTPLSPISRSLSGRGENIRQVKDQQACHRQAPILGKRHGCARSILPKT